MAKSQIPNLNQTNINKLITTIERIHNLSLITNQYCNSQKYLEELNILSSLTQIICEDTTSLKKYFENFKVINKNTLCLNDTE